MNDYGGMVRQLMMAAIPVADKNNPLGEGLSPFGITEGARGYSGGSGLVPAMRKDGKVYTGAPGQTHADVYIKHRDVLKGQFDEGFALGGKYLTRQEALKHVDMAQPKVSNAYRAEAAEKLGGGRTPESVRGLEALEYNDALKFFGSK